MGMTLKEARRYAGLSQGQLARLAGFSTVASISDIEIGRNRRPAHDTVTRIMRGLHRAGLAGLTIEDIDEFVVPEPQTPEPPAGEAVSA